MAQTAPPLPGEGTPRPLPRGGRPLRSRDTRPRFQPLDAFWMALAAAVGIAGGLARHADVSALSAMTGVILLTYLIGWRAAGRPAGVVGALLTATSALFASSAGHAPMTDLFTLVTLGALFAFVAGSSLAALVLAAAAVWLRADGIVLGLLLMAFTLVQHRRRAWIGVLIFCVPTLAAMAVPRAYGGNPFFGVTFGFHPTLLLCLAAPATLFASWFLLPFFGEMTDPVRRARWLPVLLWTALTVVLGSVLSFGPAAMAPAALVPSLPLWFLLAGAGLARLLPAMTGDLPIPWLRYAVATLAVLSVVAIRARVEWTPEERPHAVPAPVTAPVPHVAAAVTTPPAVAPPKPVPIRPTPPPKAAPKPAQVVRPKAARPQVVRPKAVVRRAVKPSVKQYVVKNGRLVHRSKWAIEWDRTHPHA